MLNQNSVGGLIEREREQIFLQGALDALRSGNPEMPKAIFITGPAGSGRSALLDLVAQQARHSIQFAAEVYCWPANQDGIPALAALFSEDETSPLYPYLGTYRDRVQTAAELESRVEQIQLGLGLPDLKKLAWGVEQDEGRYRAVQALPPSALHFLLRRLYTMYTPNQLSEQAAAFIKTGLEHIIQLNATNLGQLRVFVEEELRPQFRTDEWEFYLRPDETLANDLASSINSYVDKERPLVLLFDNYRAGEGDRFLRPLIEATRRTLWIFATEPYPAWAEKLSHPAVLRLDGLTGHGVALYFEKTYGRALTPEELVWLNTLTRQSPLPLYIAADLYAHGTSAADLDAAVGRTAGDPLAGLFLYFVEESGRLSDEERHRLYSMAILCNSNPDFLGEFEKAVKAAGYPYDFELTNRLFETYPWLAEQANRLQSSSEPKLHPALKERLRLYLMLEQRRFSRPVQEGILEPARNVALAILTAIEERLVAQEQQGSLQARATDEEWGVAVGDSAYHRFWLDEGVGWVFLLPRWLMAFAYNRPLAHQLLGVAESMKQTFYTEGRELLPYLRTLLQDSYLAGRKSLDDKIKALEEMDKLGSSGRGRWFRSENLGVRPTSKGSAEAELRGILKWAQAQVYEEAGQYEKVAPLYEEVLTTNVEMPELKKAAAHAALYLAMRYRLRNAHENAYSALYRAAELNDQQHAGVQALFWQSVRLTRYDTALKAADALSELSDPDAGVFMLFALYALGRQPEALTEVRTLVAQPATDAATLRASLVALVRYATLPEDTAELTAILNEIK